MAILRLFLIACCYLLLPTWVTAQECGCIDCPLSISNESGTTTEELCFIVENVSSDDLSSANQCVEQVNINFIHNRLQNLQVFLTSPDGTRVQLIGDYIPDGLELTLGASFDISFVSSEGNPAPDFNNFTIWDNEQFLDDNGSEYTGSYHPYDGPAGLDQFNTGNVNGEWCLEIINSGGNYGGTINDFSVSFCDETGLDCCQANAGDLFMGEVYVCEGADTLDLPDIEPIYSNSVPANPDNYTYNYLIARTDTIISIVEDPDLRDPTTFYGGLYTICGFSYDRNQVNELPIPNSGDPKYPYGAFTLNEFRTELNDPNAVLCGDISINCITIEIAAPPTLISPLRDTICAGETYRFGANTYDQSGLYMDTLRTAAGCDSIHNLELFVAPNDRTDLGIINICQGEVYEVGSTAYINTGVYEPILQNQYGCDSIVSFDLRVLQAVQTNLSETICENLTYEVGDSIYNQTGNYRNVFQAFSGCDSIVFLNLVVDTVHAIVAVPDSIDCDSESVILDGSASDTGVGYSYEWRYNIAGPDEVIDNTLTTEVDTPGDYLFVVTSPNNCKGFRDVTVHESFSEPEAVITPLGTLTCSNPQVELSSDGSNGQGDITYSWATNNGGNINGSTTTPTINATTTGTYELTVTNVSNGCSNTARFELMLEGTVPTAVASVADSLTCTRTSVVLSNVGSDTEDVAYFWADINGTAINPNNVTTTGLYVLTVLNNQNGCSSSDTVRVGEEIMLPEVLIETPNGNINCGVTTLDLDANNSEQGTNFTYNWTSTNGNIISGTTTLMPTVNAAGVYQLEITNTETGCVNVDSVQVIADFDPPNALASIVNSQQLNCRTDSVLLEGSPSSGNAPLNYSWEDFNQIEISTASSVYVQEGGAYLLIVEDSENLCRDSMTIGVTEDYTLPIADAGTPVQLDCANPQRALSGSGSSMGANISATWTGPGNITGSATFTPTVNTAGTFYLSIQNTDNGCIAMDSVLVTQDADLPSAQAGNDASIDCTTPTLQLSGTDPNTTPNLDYLWTSIEGNTIIDETTLTPTIDAGGAYVLTITNPDNNCSASDTLTVTADFNPPPVDAGDSSAMLDCGTPSYILNGQSTAPNSTGIWTTTNGNINGDPNTSNPIADAAGTYTYTLTNLDNGCTASDSIIISADFEAPIIMVIDPSELTCQNTTTTLDASNSMGRDLVYEWTTNNGNLIGSTNTSQTTVDQPGRYLLTLIDNTNSCTDTLSVAVTQDRNVPSVSTANELMVNCTTGQVTLDGRGSSTGLNFVYEWTSVGGMVIFGQDALVAQGQGVGTYTLTIRDTLNNCEASSSINVTQDCVPEAIATTNDTITCYEPTAVVVTANPSEGTNFMVEWFDLAEMSLSTEDTLRVGRGGFYILEVTNVVLNTMDRDTIEVIDARVFPTVDIGMGVTLDCNNPTTILDASNSSNGSEFEFEWTTFGGSFLQDSTTLTPTVNSGGIYTLEILNTINGCVSADNVQILEDATFLEVCVSSSTDIGCGQSSISIDASCSTTNATTTYEWTTNNGNIIDGENTLLLNVDATGTYTLTITDTSNGCMVSENIVITRTDCDLSVNAGTDTIINCNNPSVILEGIINPTDNNYIIEWRDSDGIVVGTMDTLEVTTGDTYTFFVRDTITGLEDSDNVFVGENKQDPIVSAGADQTLNCNITNVSLIGTSSTTNAVYLWTSLEMHPIVNADSLTINVDSAGTYVLEVIDTINGCRATDIITVFANQELPEANAGADATFTCMDNNISLDGSASSNGTNISYNWIALEGNGNVCGSENTNTPSVCSAGQYEIIVTNDATGCLSRDTVEVIADENIPVISAGEGATFTCAIQEATLQGEGPVGANFSLLWVDFEGDTITSETYTPTVDQAGEYTLTVTDITNGCRASATTLINLDTLAPIVNAGTNALITCEENEVELNGSVENAASTYTYQWVGMPGDSILNDTSLQATVFQAGEYTLIVTDTINQCIDSASVNVFLDDEVPNAFAGDDITLTCTQPNMTLTGSSTTDNVIYQWLDSEGSIVGNMATLLVSDPDVYTLVVTDTTNNCAVDDRVMVDIDQTIPNPTISATQDELTCDENTATLSAAITDMGTFTYTWTRNQEMTLLGSMDTLTISQEGTYILTIQDQSNGCENTASYTITSSADLPNVEITTPDNFDCTTRQVTLDASASEEDGHIYLWTNAAGDSLGNGLTLDITQIGIYTFIITEPMTGCENQASVEVTTDGELPNISINSNRVNLTCDENTATLSANASANGDPLSYLWTNSSGTTISNNRQANVNTGGWYYLEVTNTTSNCSNQDSILIRTEESLISGFNISITEPNCFGEGVGSLNIDNITGGTAPYSYSLNNEPFKLFPAFSNLSPDTYTLTIEDAFGCQRDTIFTITQVQELIVDLGPDQIIQLGDSIIVEAQINDEFQNLQWLPKENFSCGDCPTQVLSPLETTTYNIMVTNADGCTSSDELTIQVAKERLIYIPNIFSPNNDGHNDLFLLSAGDGVEKIEILNIYDRWGNLMFSANDFQPNDPSVAWDGTFAGKSLNPGVFVYYAHIIYLDGHEQMLTGDVTIWK